MAGYTVVASNKWFFMTLVVDAANQADAAEKFRAYLAAPEQQAHEEYEADQVKGMGDETDPETLVRENYRYTFRQVDVEEYDGAATATIQMVNSGGNG